MEGLRDDGHGRRARRLRPPVHHLPELTARLAPDDPRLAPVAAALGAAIRRARRLPGGDTCAAYLVETTDGRRLFAKTGDGLPPDFFRAEAAGLAALAATRTVRVPAVVAVSEGPAPALVLEGIATGDPPPGFGAVLGAALASLHAAAPSARCGFDRDGYLGRTPQPNPWTADAAAFWRDHRLAPLLARARALGRSTPDLDRAGDAALARTADLLAGAPVALLHGDLWSGNVLCAAGGAPVLVDPAAHYGPREADLALARLFGGFDDAFFAAYAEALPLDAGEPERRPLFAAYHLLNHLCLFGPVYLEPTLRALRRLG